MRPSRYLRELERTTSSRLARLEVLARSADSMVFREADKLISFVTIEVLNTWGEFVRCYLLSCSLHPWSSSGVRITLANARIRTFEDVLRIAILKRKKPLPRRGRITRRDEPSWHEPQTLLLTSQEMGCSNLGNVHAALSTGTRAYKDLPTFRNFYAHRNPETATKTKRIATTNSISSRLHPTEILRSAAPGRPEVLLVDWIADLTTTVKMLCQ